MHPGTADVCNKKSQATNRSSHRADFCKLNFGHHTGLHQYAFLIRADSVLCSRSIPADSIWNNDSCLSLIRFLPHVVPGTNHGSFRFDL